MKDAGLPSLGPGGDREVRSSHTVEAGDNFRKEQFSKTEFQQNRSSNVQVTSSGQVVEQRQLVKQQRTVTVMSKTSKTSSTVTSGGQTKTSLGPGPAGEPKKKRKDKFDIDSLVAKNAALAMSEDELENVSDYDNFTDTNLEISSDDGGSTTETGTVSDAETLHEDQTAQASQALLERAAEMAPDVAHAQHERETRQKPPPATATEQRQVDWGKATPKTKGAGDDQASGIPRERRRSIKELVDNFESKMSPFS